MRIIDTAKMIAGVRAAESALPAGERLIEDPYARLFAGETDEIAGRFESVPCVDDRSFGDIYRRYFGAESESDAAELFRLAVAER